MLISHNKKGVNDISIAGFIILLFVVIGTLLPYINAEYGGEVNTIDTDIIDVDDVSKVSGQVSVTGILGSIAKMFFWTFGELPFWLDMFFIVFRIILLAIIGRNLWFGGGA